MNKKQKPKKDPKLRLIGVGYLFSIVALTISVFAYMDARGILSWFTANRTAGANNQHITPTVESGFVKQIDVYATDENDIVANRFISAPLETYTVDANNNVIFTKESDQEVRLWKYSRLECNKSLLYLVTLNKEAWRDYYNTFTVTMETSTASDKSLYAFDENSHLAKNQLDSGDKADSNNKMSNISRFYAFDVRELVTKEPTIKLPDNTSKTIKCYDFSSETGDKASSFVNKDTAGSGKTETYSYSSDDVTFYSETYASKEDVPSYLAIIVEYYPAAIEYVYSLNLGNSVLYGSSSSGSSSDMENSISFVSDMTMKLS